MKALTAKQKRFCEEYVKDINGKAAAIRAGYKATSAESQASKNLAIDSVKYYIKQLQIEIAQRNDISADMVIKELASIGFYNVQDLITDDMSIVNLKKSSREMVKPVVGIEVTETVTGTGKNRKKTVNTKVKLADKVNALIHLGKHLGIFEKDNRQKSQKIRVTVKE